MGMPVIYASNTKRKQSITDILESVALEQTALSHILNAGGEGLQKILCMKHIRPEAIFKANESIEHLISCITKFEIVLESKLAMFGDCLCPNADSDEVSFENDDFSEEDED